MGTVNEDIKSRLTSDLKTPSKLVLFIPQELEDAKPDIQRFFDAMLYKLRRNAHKGKWEDLDVETALKRLNDEVEELIVAIQEGSTAEIVFEAADVGNFALILANIALLRQSNDNA